MDEEVKLIKNGEPILSPLISVGCCLALSIIYVASLYIWSWSSTHDRNHPTTVKRRFLSVSIAMLISPAFFYFSAPEQIFEHAPIWELLGFRIDGFLQAAVIPLLLTVVLFMGPIVTQAQSPPPANASPTNTNWFSMLTDWLWLRNHIVAPLSEEFTFRACMMPLLLLSFRPITAVFITPLFFGVAHLHHIVERIQSGMEIKTVLLISSFQLAYTTIFGTYSAYLFARTGHFIAPFIAHAFCNHQGFPDLPELLNQPKSKRIYLGLCYVVGLGAWMVLLPIVTEPSWYSNNIWWNNET